MANKKSKKSKINTKAIGVVCAVVAVIVVIVVVAIAANSGKRLDDAYFQSDDTKYVLTMEYDTIDFDEDEITDYMPVKSHTVYEYKDDAITGMTSYLEFADNAAAEAALEYWQENMGDSYTKVYVDGKYIVAVASEEIYADASATEVKEQIDAINALKEMDLSGLESENDDGVEVEVEETTDDAE